MASVWKPWTGQASRAARAQLALAEAEVCGPRFSLDVGLRVSFVIMGMDSTYRVSAGCESPAALENWMPNSTPKETEDSSPQLLLVNRSR